MKLENKWENNIKTKESHAIHWFLRRKKGMQINEIIHIIGGMICKKFKGQIEMPFS